MCILETPMLLMWKINYFFFSIVVNVENKLFFLLDSLSVQPFHEAEDTVYNSL